MALSWEAEGHPVAWRQLGAEVCAVGFDMAGAGYGEISDAVVSVFFPSGCRICDRLLTSASQVPLCEECLSSFAPVLGILCEVCGRPLPGLNREPEQPLLCPACQDKKYAFARARSFALYENAVVRAILLLKFEQIEPLGACFADRLAEIVSAEGRAIAADVVVPVPLHRERELERGYNHERWESVRGAFATRPGSQVDNLRVLLVDNVLTTGATRVACARALRDAAGKSLIGLTAARPSETPCQAPESGKIGGRRRDGSKPAHVGGFPGALHPGSHGRGHARFRGSRWQ